MIITNIRSEAGTEAVRLKAVQGYFLDTVKLACTLARREIVLSEDGLIPGCTETAAAATLRYLLGQTTTLEQHFPKTVTLEELQTFNKPSEPIILDSLTEELIAFDKTYPGTTRSITKYAQRRR